MAGHFRKELEHLILPRGRICIVKDGLASLLSMGKLVKEGYRVTMDSDVKNEINVYNEDLYVSRTEYTVLVLTNVASILISLPQLLSSLIIFITMIIRGLP